MKRIRTGGLGASALAISGLAIALPTPVIAQEAGVGARPAGIEDIVVTARRRAENVQDVPLSVQAFSPDTLKQQGIQEIRSLQFAVPGLAIQPGTFRDSTPMPYIRGFAGGGLQIDSDPSIPFIINEVPINTPQGQNAAFFDIANVQVLKGPQGTLQGRNTVGGAMLITTKRPDLSEYGGYVTGQLGNYDQFMGEAVLNLPIVTDRVGLRLGFRHEERDGTWVNIADGRDYADRNNYSVRASLLANVTDDIETLTVYDRTWSREHGSALVFIGKGFDYNDRSTWPTGGQVIPCQTSADLCGFHNIGVMLIPGYAEMMAGEEAYQRSLGWGRFDSFATRETSRLGKAPFEKILNWGISNTTTINLGEITVKNIMGYRRMLSELYEDIDGTSVGGTTTVGAPTAIIETHNGVNFRQFTEELQLQGTALEDNVNWITGVFFSRYSGTDSADVATLGSRQFNYYHVVAKSLGLYGQVDVNMTDRLTLTGGFRYTWDKRRAQYRQFSGAIPLRDNSLGLLGSYGRDIVLPEVTDPALCNFNRNPAPDRPAGEGVDFSNCAYNAKIKGHAPSYNITMQYRPVDAAMVYLTHRRGYRGASLAARATTTEGVRNQEEVVQDLELGVKSDFFVAGMPVRLNAAAYHSWYNNIAVTISKIDEATGLSVNQAENSGKARLYGGEVDLEMHPLEGLSLKGTWGYTYGKFTNFPEQTVNDGLGNPLIYYPNDNVQFAYPRHTFTLGAAWTLPLDESIGAITPGVNYYHASKRPDFGSQVSSKGFSTLPSYGLLNARIDWRNAMGHPVDVAFFMNNVTNKRYYNAVFSIEDALGFRTGMPGDPRLYGVSLTMRFGSERN